jgi:hypothetical protein
MALRRRATPSADPQQVGQDWMKRRKQQEPAGQPPKIAAESIDKLGDFTTSPRVVLIGVIAVVVGTAGVASGVILLNLIRLFTNLAYFGRVSLATPIWRGRRWG